MTIEELTERLTLNHNPNDPVIGILINPITRKILSVTLTRDQARELSKFLFTLFDIKAG